MPWLHTPFTSHWLIPGQKPVDLGAWEMQPVAASSAPPSPRSGAHGASGRRGSKGHLAQCVDMNPQRQMPYFMPWICPGGGN